mgnify:FL=1
MKSFSFVVVTYNSNHLIENCVSSIRKFSEKYRGDVEVIIVDNSTAETYNELTQICERIKPDQLIHNSKNGGYGQGNNVGINASKGEIIAIMNPDVILTQIDFDKVSNLFLRNKKLGIAGGRQFGGQNLSFWVRPEYDFSVFSSPLFTILNRLGWFSERWMFLSGAFLLLDKKKFKEIGMFDENIFLYCEESDITLRNNSKGYKAEFIKDVTYQHLINDREKLNPKTLEIFYKTLKYYMSKYHFSLKSYLMRRIVSYQIMLFIFKVTFRKDLYQQYSENLAEFKKLLSYDFN